MDFNTISGLLQTIFTIYQFMIFGYILMSWIPALQQSAFGEFLGKLVEPYLSIFRKFIPPIGMIDISPIIALFALRYILLGLLIVIQNIYGFLM
jgi:YggT family protein